MTIAAPRQECVGSMRALPPRSIARNFQGLSPHLEVDYCGHLVTQGEYMIIQTDRLTY